MHNRDEDSNAGPRKGSNMEIERVKERKKERERKRDIMQTEGSNTERESESERKKEKEKKGYNADGGI